MHKWKSDHVSAHPEPQFSRAERQRSYTNNHLNAQNAGPRVHTVNITINQYAENKAFEEEKLSRIINESIKSIAKIIESSSNEKQKSIAKPKNKHMKLKKRDRRRGKCAHETI